MRASRVCLWALVLISALLARTNAFALNPSSEGDFRASLAKLTQGVDRLNERLSASFRPGATKAESESDEMAWRVRDLREKTQKLNVLSQDYWNKETDILGILDQWHQDAKLIDEAMIYSPVTQEISDLWKQTKELGMQVRDFVEEMPSQKEWDKVLEDFGFDIVKVVRYPKKQVLRERMKEFIGSSELDKWPFADERRDLSAKDVGEHFVVRFRMRPKGKDVLSLPLKLRFEYKFALHNYDGAEQAVYRDLRKGTHDFLFKNIGKDFSLRGKIIHWRASLLMNEKVVAQKKSSMWTVVSEWAQK